MAKFMKQDESLSLGSSPYAFTLVNGCIARKNADVLFTTRAVPGGTSVPEVF